MRVLLDENVPRKLKRAFASGYDVATVQERGWSGVLNGELLRRADAEFEGFVTLDRGIEYQQDLADLSVRIVIVRAFSNTLSDLVPLVPSIQSALERSVPGALAHVAGQATAPPRRRPVLTARAPRRARARAPRRPRRGAAAPPTRAP